MSNATVSCVNCRNYHLHEDSESKCKLRNLNAISYHLGFNACYIQLSLKKKFIVNIFSRYLTLC